MSEDDIKPIDMDMAPEPEKKDDVIDDDLPEIDHDKVMYGASVSRIKKGEEVDLSEMDPTLVHALIGMGWDLKNFENLPVDLDSSVFLLDKDDRTRENEDFIFYNNHEDRIGSVIHDGDSRTGAGEGDDETVNIQLTKLTFDVVKIVFVISIHDEEMLGHSFNDVKNVYFRFVNTDSTHELFRFELEGEELNMGEAQAMIVAEMERVGPKWMFRALAEPVEGGLSEIATNYGIIVAEIVQA
ncbi:MAG: TerD family protein [Pseudomonadota bacterium]